MAQWIEVKVRYEKTAENGKTVKVTEPYLVDALSCTEAEARLIEEITPQTSEFNVLAVNKTKISEIFRDARGDRYYKVKVNFISIDEKTHGEKRTATFILVQASSFESALRNFKDGMNGTLADYEIESIVETKIMDVYDYIAKTPQPDNSTPLSDNDRRRVQADDHPQAPEEKQVRSETYRPSRLEEGTPPSRHPESDATRRTDFRPPRTGILHTDTSPI